ncbi:MAG: RrF2 family transcriptional regulator [Actinomycetota bacterium]
MALFTSKVDYAMRALLDLAVHAGGRPAQSREIAARQEIPESYLNQLLVVLRRAGLVRSIRGASGGYALGKEPRLITVEEVVKALHGSNFLGELSAEGAQLPTAWVIRNLNAQLNRSLQRELAAVTLSDLVTEVQRLDESQSLMLGL